MYIITALYDKTQGNLLNHQGTMRADGGQDTPAGVS